MNQPTKIVHIVSSLDRVNFGVWNAAFFGASYLKRAYGLNTACWVCRQEEPEDPKPDFPVTYLDNAISSGRLRTLAAQQDLSPRNTVFVSHGCWLAASRVGYALQKYGFRWIHVPHGMLEPWSLQQGRLKKMIYFRLREKRYIMSADQVRAVSRIEKQNLEKMLERSVVLVENGVIMPETTGTKDDQQTVFLFMARLHFKKGIVPLVRAWQRIMGEQVSKTLVIAGPDEGELEKIRPWLRDNVRYIGAVYGKDKRDWLSRAHYYFLPSYSEGFPTSVLEAMSYGLIPLISAGCNFPEVLNEGLGYRAEPDEDQLAELLSQLRDMPFDASLSARNREYIAANYAEEVIGEEMYKLYAALLTE